MSDALKLHDAVLMVTELSSPDIALVYLAADVDAARARDAKRSALLEGDVKNAMACWHAACNDIAERDATIAELRKDAERYRQALEDIETIVNGTPSLINEYVNLACGIAHTALGAPKGET